MTKLVLEGGTDVAEVALFCINNRPYTSSGFSSIADLEEQNLIIRIPTGSDGGYLLHLYADEEVDKTLLEFCNRDDALSGEFHAISSAIAFGGIESVNQEFVKNTNIRSNAEISKGMYSYTAYRTDYPDDLIEDQVMAAIGKEGYKYISLPDWISPLSLVLGITLLVLTINTNYLYGAALSVLFFSVRYWRQSYTKSEKYKRLNEAKLAVERNYPSIVIKLEMHT